MKLLTIIILLFGMNASADTIDRINSCEQAGGGACVFDILRELASRTGRGGRLLKSGTYASESWTVEVSHSPGSLRLFGGSGGVSEEGDYSCKRGVCTGKYEITINNKTQFTVQYESSSRVWNLRR